MIDSILNLLTADEVNALNALVRLFLSMVLGASVGAERMKKGQMAGMRTFALISSGATLAMLVSIFIPQEFLGLKNGDPGRIAAQVVSGIGFLGAGAIIQSKGSVRGLTTAAGIWCAAMIGLAVGAGMYLIALLATALIYFILVALNRYEHIVRLGGETKIIRIKVRGIVSDLAPMRQTFRTHHIHVSDEYMKFEYDNDLTIINFIIRCRTDTDFIPLFNDIHLREDLVSIMLANEVTA